MTNENDEIDLKSSGLGIGTTVDGDAVTCAGQPKSEMTAGCCEAEPTEKRKKIGKVIKLDIADHDVKYAKRNDHDASVPDVGQSTSDIAVKSSSAESADKSETAGQGNPPPDVECFDFDGCEAPVLPLEQMRQSARDDYELMLCEIMEEFQSIGRCPPFTVGDHDWDQTSRAMLAFEKSREAFEAISKYRRVPAAKRDAFLEDPLYPEVAYLFREFKHQVRCYYPTPNRGYLQRAILLSHEIVEHVGVITKQRRWSAQDQVRELAEESKTQGALKNREIREGRTQQRLRSDGKESRVVSYARKSAVRR